MHHKNLDLENEGCSLAGGEPLPACFLISGRYIQDNILLSHELPRNSHLNGGPPRCAAKIDLRKAYDTVE